MKKSRGDSRARSIGGPAGQLTIQKGPVFSARQRTVLRYCEYVSLNPALGVSSTYVFSANGLYDPNYSGTGHQPLGFDQWMTFYDHYHVVRSSMKATIIPSDTTAANAAAFGGVLLRDSAGSMTGADVSLLLEQKPIGASAYKQIPLVYDRATVVRSIFDYGKFYGVSDLLASSVLRGDVANNPTEQAYYHIWVAPLSAGLDLPSMVLLAEIEYDVVFSEPKTLAQS